MLTIQELRRLLTEDLLERMTSKEISKALCPYPDGVDRDSWESGFFEAMTERNILGDIDRGSEAYVAGRDAWSRLLATGKYTPEPYSAQYAPSPSSEIVRWRIALVESMVGFQALENAFPDIDWTDLKGGACILLMRELAENWAQATQEVPTVYDPDSLIADLDGAIALLQQWRGHAIGVLVEANRESMGEEPDEQ